MSQIASSGGQPQKQPKYAPIYTGRFFNGINTNRSPLRAATASHIYEKFYSDTSGDALIAGANLEVTNRLTLARRPGNPIYDTTHSGRYVGYNNPDAFTDFRVNKASSDVFGTVLESIYTMIDEATTPSYQGYLYSLTSALVRGGDAGYYTGLAFQKAVGSGQAFTQAVGNELYFSDGVDNKKWLTSLFMRTDAGDNTQLQGTDGLAGTYPFGTYLIDPATGNPQEFIGIVIGVVTAVSITNNELTLTVTLAAPGAEPSLGPPTGTTTIKAGTSFQLWGMSTNTFLNGATITLDNDYTYGSSTTLTAPFKNPDMSASESGPGYIVQAGTTPVIALTGSSVPTWGTTVPTAVNDFFGSLTLDGNTLWINRGTPSTGGASVENWGIKAPTDAPTFNVTGQEQAWAPNTYYSPASVFVDPNGNLWQITTAGKTGGTQPVWTNPPTPQQKIVISSVAITSNVVTFITDTQSPALHAGDTVVIQNLAVATFLNGQTLTVLAGGLTTTGFTAAFTYTGSYAAAADYGYGTKTAGTAPPSTKNDGSAVWTSIQLAASLVWQANHHYNEGDFLIATIGGVKQLFQLGISTQPFVNTAISTVCWNKNYSFAGQFDKSYPAPAADFTISAVQGLHWVGNPPPQNTQLYAVNGAGLVGAATDSGHYENWEAAILCTVFIPVAGTYTFSLAHDDGAFFSFDTSTGAKLVSGTPNNILGNKTAVQGYTGVAGNNVSGQNTDSASWNFPAAGEYGLEIDWCNWEHASCMIFSCPGPAAMYTTTSGGQDLAVGRSVSGATAPVWPTFTTTGAQYNSTTGQIVWAASVVEVATAGQQYLWNNLGPVGDFLWQASTEYTLPGTTLIDPNGNQQGAYETGISGKSAPPWSTAADTGITADTNPPLTFLNEGPVPALTETGNTITATTAQGWLYWIALVNTLDQTVSNLSPVSIGTGPVVKGQVTFAPGAGLNPASIDPQTDYVAIFRSADGFSTPLLIPGFVNSPYTVPLTQYLEYGYVDTVPDVELNNLVQGPLGLENTPPLAGTVNLTYHLNRIWYSRGNTVYWTSGPTSPIGNGDGTAPGNAAALPSQVKRLVPTAIGMIVFTQSDVYIIAGNGTSGSPILPAIPYLIGVGLGNYNALDVNGGLIGFFTTDKQFVIFDPSAGLNYCGFNIGDQFRLNNGIPGQSWDINKVYISWYVSGEDAGWYASDGVNGWYRMIYTPAPEAGNGVVAWSPFATIQGSCGAIASIETSPGVHQLLIGQTVQDGNILARNLTATTDNGTTPGGGTVYPAYGVIGSIVLANPGQIAKIAHITTVCVRTGSPLVMGIILNEALPYYQGAFDILKRSVSDPPGLPESKSFYRQRFYLDQNENASAYCMDLQILVQFPPEAAQNELQALTIFGAYEVEQ
jgi:hypothetical protein